MARSFGLARLIAGLFYGTGANESFAVLSFSALRGAISLDACYLLAHRALCVDPVAAIREL